MCSDKATVIRIHIAKKLTLLCRCMPPFGGIKDVNNTREGSGGLVTSNKQDPVSMESK
jgi:hypothetical protein